MPTSLRGPRGRVASVLGVQTLVAVDNLACLFMGCKTTIAFFANALAALAVGLAARIGNLGNNAAAIGATNTVGVGHRLGILFIGFAFPTGCNRFGFFRFRFCVLGSLSWACISTPDNDAKTQLPTKQSK